MEKKILKRLIDLTCDAHKLGKKDLFRTLGILEMVKLAIVNQHKKQWKK